MNDDYLPSTVKRYARLISEAREHGLPDDREHAWLCDPCHAAEPADLDWRLESKHEPAYVACKRCGRKSSQVPHDPAVVAAWMQRRALKLAQGGAR
jgi:RNase P subunit RPR2